MRMFRPICFVLVALSTLESIAWAEGPEFRIWGNVRAKDGQALEKTRIGVVVRKDRGSTHFSASIKDGRFEQRFREEGSVYIAATTNGLAPRFLGPLTIGRKQPALRVDIVFDEGFEGNLRLVSEKGRAIPKAVVKVAYVTSIGSIHHMGRYTSDAGGRVRIPNCPPNPLRVEVSARGFEWDQRRDQRLKTNEPREWTLKSALGTRGRVLSRNGEPVSGATLRLLRRSEPFAMGFGRSSGPMLGKTDSRGRFLLASLRRDSTYAVLVDAEGHGAVLVESVSAGDSKIEIELPEEVRVRGTVTGDLGQLSTYRKKPQLRWSETFGSDEDLRSMGHSAPLEVSGGKGSFQLKDVIGSRIRIYGEHYDLPKDGSTLQVTVNLAPKRAKDERTLRPLAIRFQTPDGVEVGGTIRVFSRASSKGKGVTPIWKDGVNVVDGKSTIRIHAPGVVEISARRTRGFLFDKQKFEIPEGTEEYIVEVEGRAAGTIRGVVSAANGEPATGSVNLSVRAADKSVASLSNFRVDANGRFEIAPLELGHEYVVIASQGKLYVRSEAVRVESANRVPSTSLRFVRGTPLKGRVVGSDDEPLRAVEVGLRLEHEFWSTSFSPSLKTTRLGYFDAGKHNPDFGAFWANVKPKKTWQPGRFRLRSDGETSVVKLQRGEVVEGTVVDESGKPIEGVTLLARPKFEAGRTNEWNEAYEAEGPTGPDGKFRFSTLSAERTYTLWLSGSARSLGGNRVEFAPTATKRLRVTGKRK